MSPADILRTVDHTLLSPAATREQIFLLCDEGIAYHTASVCLPPVYVREAADYVQGAVPVCTVIGFPNGYSTTAAKCRETEEALRGGAAEIDMVLQLGWLKDRRFDEVLREIREVKNVCGPHILKVIIETCLLTEEEKLRMCDIVSRSGAEFIKTSTGFSSGGATREDVALLRAHSAPHVSVKAAGGIATLQDAEELLACGASRLGTSRLIRLVQEADRVSD